MLLPPVLSCSHRAGTFIYPIFPPACWIYFSPKYGCAEICINCIFQKCVCYWFGWLLLSTTRTPVNIRLEFRKLSNQSSQVIDLSLTLPWAMPMSSGRSRRKHNTVSISAEDLATLPPFSSVCAPMTRSQTPIWGKSVSLGNCAQARCKVARCCAQQARSDPSKSREPQKGFEENISSAVISSTHTKNCDSLWYKRRVHRQDPPGEMLH